MADQPQAVPATPPANAQGGESAATATPPATGKLFSQAELESKIDDRLARERKKYADYAELKKAADELAEFKKSQMSEQEKLAAALAEKDKKLAEMQGKISAYELEKVKLAKLQAAGVSSEWIDSVPGSNEDEIEASVAKLAGRLKAVPPVTPAGAQGAGNPGVPPARPGEKTLDEQIAEAEAAAYKDPRLWNVVTNLKLKKQGVL